MPRRPGRPILMPEEAAAKLERLARARGTTPGRVVAELLAGIPDPGDVPAVATPPEPPATGRPGRRLRWTPEAVLDAIRARWAAGLPIGSAVVQVEASQLFKRGSAHFGTWGAALEAAGVAPTTDRNIGAPLLGLRRVRLSRGYTLAHLSGRAGISAGHLSELERGRYLPTRETAAAIAAALGVEVGEVVEG